MIDQENQISDDSPRSLIFTQEEIDSQFNDMLQELGRTSVLGEDAPLTVGVDLENVELVEPMSEEQVKSATMTTKHPMMDEKSFG